MRRRILLIEDNPGDVDLVREGLSSFADEIELTVAVDGEEALARLRADWAAGVEPALVLLDLNLPRMDGRELLAWIKGDALLRRIPVVVLTTSRSETDIRRCYDLHANCYVVKPIDLEAAFATVAAIEKFWLHVALVPNETTR